MRTCSDWVMICGDKDSNDDDDGGKLRAAVMVRFEVNHDHFSLSVNHFNHLQHHLGSSL
jgi:hypothetical protein